MATTPDNTALIAQFKAGMDDKSAAAMADRLAAAEADRDAARAALEQANARPDLTADLQAANDRANAAEKDRDAARADLAKANDQLTNANEELATITAQEAAGKPRALAPAKDPKPTDPDEIADARTALRAKIADADDVEIMFSDGRKQIKDLGTFAISGDAWKDSPLGLMLAKPIDLYGTGIGGATLVVAGYALLLDGDVVSYTTRDPLQIQPGAHIKLENDIYF